MLPTNCKSNFCLVFVTVALDQVKSVQTAENLALRVSIKTLARHARRRYFFTVSPCAVGTPYRYGTHSYVHSVLSTAFRGVPNARVYINIHSIYSKSCSYLGRIRVRFLRPREEDANHAITKVRTRTFVDHRAS